MVIEFWGCRSQGHFVAITHKSSIDSTHNCQWVNHKSGTKNPFTNPQNRTTHALSSCPYLKYERFFYCLKRPLYRLAKDTYSHGVWLESVKDWIWCIRCLGVNQEGIKLLANLRNEGVLHQLRGASMVHAGILVTNLKVTNCITHVQCCGIKERACYLTNTKSATRRPITVPLLGDKNLESLESKQKSG